MSLLFTSFVTKAMAVKKIEQVQIWTFTPYELSLLRESQKNEFALMLLNESKNNFILKNLISSKDEQAVKNTLLSYEKWEKVEFRINNSCVEQINFAACEKIAQLRHDVLNKYRAHK
jgi:hypothetical protein